MQRNKPGRESNKDVDLSDIPWDETVMGHQEDTRRKIFSRLQKSKIRAIRKKKIIQTLSAAAVLLAILVPSVYFIWQNSSADRAEMGDAITAGESTIIPGGDKARLLLSDGTILLLENENNGTISKEGEVLINKNEKQLVYQGTSDAADGKVVHNTISTPRGGQFQVVLPDGSHVWLNAASSLRFPTAFTGGKRQVELSGEAYFEIAPDKRKPFRVITDNMEIEVLGTHFNVKAYADENDVETTLIEGSVAINTEHDKALLQPGQEAQLKKNSDKMSINRVDPEMAIAWKYGYFQFDKEHLYSIMRKISRWYDVEVVYKADFPDKNFTGSISRYEQVSEVLNLLELTGVVHFQIEGRRIIVMP